MEKVYVRSGVLLDAIKKLLKNLGEPFEKGFANLADMGVGVEEVDKSADGSQLTCEHIFLDSEGKSHPVTVDMTAEDASKDTWLIQFTSMEDSSKHEKYDNININEIATELPKMDQEVARKFFGIDRIEKVQGSKKIGVTLQKVTSSEGINIELGPVMCSTVWANDAYSMIDQVCQNDDFINTIPCEPTQYCIEDCGDAYDAEACAFEPTPLCDVLLNLYSYTGEVLAVAKVLYLNSSKFKREGQEIMWVLRECEENLAGLYTLKCIAPVDVHDHYAAATSTEETLRTMLQGLIDLFNLYYANVDHDTQFKFDAWINRLQDYMIQNPLEIQPAVPPIPAM